MHRFLIALVACLVPLQAGSLETDPFGAGCNPCSFGSGSIYSSAPVTLGANDSFSTSFHFQFTDPLQFSTSSENPCCGITLILYMQQSPSDFPQAGFSGAALGYTQNNLQRSVGVEFDSDGNHAPIVEGPNTFDVDAANPSGAAGALIVKLHRIQIGCPEDAGVLINRSVAVVAQQNAGVLRQLHYFRSPERQRYVFVDRDCGPRVHCTAADREPDPRVGAYRVARHLPKTHANHRP